MASSGKPTELDQYEKSLITAEELQEACTDIYELSGESWSDLATMLDISYDVFTYWLRNGGIDESIWSKIEHKASSLKRERDAAWERFNAFCGQNRNLLFTTQKESPGLSAELTIKKDITVVKLGEESVSVSTTEGILYIAELIVTAQNSPEKPELEVEDLVQLKQGGVIASKATTLIAKELAAVAKDVGNFALDQKQDKPKASNEHDQIANLIRNLTDIQNAHNAGKIDDLTAERKMDKIKKLLEVYGYKGKPRSLDRKKKKASLDSIRKNLRTTLQKLEDQNKVVASHFEHSIYQGNELFASTVAAKHSTADRRKFYYRPSQPTYWKISR